MNYRGITIAVWFAAFFLLCALNVNTAAASALIKPANNLGLVGYWSFEDATGTQATDFSGKGNLGALASGTASPSWTGGRIGKALSFDGGDHVAITQANSLPITSLSNPYSVAFWVKGLPQDGFVFSEGGSGNNNRLTIGSNAQTCLRVTLVNSAASTLLGSCSGVVFDNTWHHVVFTDVAGVTELYIDGVSVSISNYTPSGSLTFDQTTIGARRDTVTTSRFTGLIDEFRIYNRVLSPSEAASLYSSTGVAKINGSLNNFMTAGLVGLWSFDGADIRGTTAYDRSGNGNNGTINGGRAIKGKIGQAIDLFVSNSNIPVGSGASLDDIELQGGGGATVAAWVKPRSMGGSGGGDGTIFTKGFTFRASNNNLKQLYFVRSYSSQNLSRTSESYALVLNEWQHVVATWDGTDSSTTGVKLYRNGVELSYSSSIDGLGSKSSDASATGYVSSGGSAWDGLLDDVRVYNRALSADEVKKLYRAGTNQRNSSIVGNSDGLVLWHTFDGPRLNTTTSTDSSGQGNNGTLVNTPAPAKGKIGQALGFDGVNNRIDFGSNSAVDDIELQGSGLSVSAWVKAGGYGGNGEGQIMTKGGAATLSNGRWSFQINNSSGGFKFEKSFDSTILTRVTDNAAVVINQWQHVVMTWDGSSSASNVHIYIDGVEATYRTTTDGVGNKVSDAAQVLRTNDGTRVWNGLIDDVRVYNRVLSASEVSKLYNLGK